MKIPGVKWPLATVVWFAISASAASANHMNGAPDLHQLAMTGSFYLSEEESLAIANQIIANGEDVNEPVPRRGFTALHVAAAYGNKTLAEFLVAHGADV